MSTAGYMAEMVRRHPLPLGLIGAGIAWWIYETSTGRSLSFGNGGSREEEDEGLGVGSTSTGSYRSGASWNSEGGYGPGGYDGGDEGWRQRSMHAVERSTERLRTGAHAARQSFSDAVDRNPVALGAACFSLGILAGVALPTTRWEEETMGEVSQKAKRAATDAAVRAAEQGARVAQDAAQRVRDEAEERLGTSATGSRGAGTQGREERDPWDTSPGGG
jgi:hypothetical protein